jgi:hypothetical protein
MSGVVGDGRSATRRTWLVQRSVRINIACTPLAWSCSDRRKPTMVVGFVDFDYISVPLHNWSNTMLDRADRATFNRTNPIQFSRSRKTLTS